MVSNRRRSHIHFIHQFEADTKEYTGTRIVVFYKETAKKEIYDTGNFVIHRYKNSKRKQHHVSKWSLKPCPIKNVIKKIMNNHSEDGKYEMNHVLYESPVRNLEDYLQEVKDIEIPYKL